MSANGNRYIGGDETVAVQQLSPQARIYPRLQELSTFYQKQFNAEPDFFVRVPGRVNIIGEHVDYCGYPVLPMAIDQSIILAVGHLKDSSQLQVRNLDERKFSGYDCDLKNYSIVLPKVGGPAWHNYYLCGVKGVEETLGAKWQPLGMRVAISGNVPPASGLSSSSAMVSSSVLATAHVQQMPLDRKQLASLSAKCECYIGTQSGGMDQAIAYLGRAGCAQLIEFHPKLKSTPITLPAGKTFVVANSLAEKNKAASSDYNERVVECRLATRWLAKHKQLDNWAQYLRFVELEEACNLDNEEYEQLIHRVLDKQVYTRADICQQLGVTEQQLETQFLTPNTQHMQQFKLRQRALHVIQECGRVAKFREICEQLAKGKSPQGVRELGELMRQSHQSLRELYECSHPDVERLIEIATKLDVSARITGAGWGGCIVALCDSDEAADEFIKLLKSEYYAKLPSHLLERHQPTDFNEVVFATKPCNGAELYAAH